MYLRQTIALGNKFNKSGVMFAQNIVTCTCVENELHKNVLVYLG